MGATTFSGPLRSGTKRDGADSNIGVAVLTQTQTIAQDGEAVVDAVFNLPRGAQIIDIVVDVTTAFDSATSATLTVGIVRGGTEYAGGVNAKAAGRARPIFTDAQLAAMADVGGNTEVVATLTPAGATSAGEARVSLIYAQR